MYEMCCTNIINLPFEIHSSWNLHCICEKSLTVFWRCHTHNAGPGPYFTQHHVELELWWKTMRCVIKHLGALISVAKLYHFFSVFVCLVCVHSLMDSLLFHYHPTVISRGGEYFYQKQILEMFFFHHSVECSSEWNRRTGETWKRQPENTHLLNI